MIWYLVAVPLAGVGAVLRVWLTQVGEDRLPGGAPTATGVINVMGAAAIGLLAGAGPRGCRRRPTAGRCPCRAARP